MSYPLYPADPTRDPAEPFRDLDTGPTTAATSVLDAGRGGWNDPVDDRVTAEELAERQREAFGGPKLGAAFFGWLVTAATAVLLAGLLVVADVVVGLDVLPDPWGTDGLGPIDGLAFGWTVVGVMSAAMLVAFVCGGYVAGRMARFNGVVQGVLVWAWAVATGVLAVIAVVLLDGRFRILERAADAVPAVPVAEDLMMIVAIGAGVGAVALSLGGAILGGYLGVRYHRRVDLAGVEA